MTYQNRKTQGVTPPRGKSEEDSETFKRQGPEPPENDSGPSPSVEEANREAIRSKVRRVDRQRQVD